MLSSSQNDFNIVCTKIKLNRIFTRCVTLKRAASWRDPYLCHCAQATQLLSKKCRSGVEQLATLHGMTKPRFVPPTSCSRDERITAPSTGR